MTWDVNEDNPMRMKDELEKILASARDMKVLTPREAKKRWAGKKTRTGKRKRAVPRHEYRDYINSLQWREKRDEFLSRSSRNSTCQGCWKERRPGFHTHHGTYDRLGDEYLSDLFLLCEECHFALHSYWNSHLKNGNIKKKRTLKTFTRRWIADRRETHMTNAPPEVQIKALRKKLEHVSLNEKVRHVNALAEKLRVISPYSGMTVRVSARGNEYLSKR